MDAHAIADYLNTPPTAEMTYAELEAVAGGAASNEVKISGAYRTIYYSNGSKKCVS